MLDVYFVVERYFVMRSCYERMKLGGKYACFIFGTTVLLTYTEQLVCFVV